MYAVRIPELDGARSALGLLTLVGMKGKTNYSTHYDRFSSARVKREGLEWPSLLALVRDRRTLLAILHTLTSQFNA